MSGNSPKLDLKLNLSPPRPTINNNQQIVGSPNSSVSSWPWEMSPESSCVSSEPEEESTTTTRMMQYPAPEAAISMVLVGCPRCLMYVMLSDVDPKCPRCKSTVLLDFLNEGNSKKENN